MSGVAAVYNTCPACLLQPHNGAFCSTNVCIQLHPGCVLQGGQAPQTWTQEHCPEIGACNLRTYRQPREWEGYGTCQLCPSSCTLKRMKLRRRSSKGKGARHRLLYMPRRACKQMQHDLRLLRVSNCRACLSLMLRQGQGQQPQGLIRRKVKLYS